MANRRPLSSEPSDVRTSAGFKSRSQLEGFTGVAAADPWGVLTSGGLSDQAQYATAATTMAIRTTSNIPTLLSELRGFFVVFGITAQRITGPAGSASY